MNYKRLIPMFIATLMTVCAYDASAALLPPPMLDSVVALGAMLNTSPPGEPPKIEWVTLGTGFFYGRKIYDDVEPTKRKYLVYLVTAAHVIAEFKAGGHKEISVRINSKDPSSPSQTFSISTDGPGAWFYHPGFRADDPSASPGDDIAVVQVNGQKITELGATFIGDDLAAADSAKMKSIGVSAGDSVFVLGFPMNLAGVQRNYVIVRQGIIARIGELLEQRSETFLLDSFVFPGNSGSPVILKPEIAGLAGTTAHNSAELLGVVTDYKPYTDVAISNQTHRPRITFEENSGLSDVIPLDRVDEAILAYQARP
jgi:S1-C subfamily serine protease